MGGVCVVPVNPRLSFFLSSSRLNIWHRREGDVLSLSCQTYVCPRSYLET